MRLPICSEVRTGKVAVSLPQGALERAKLAVATGRAKNLSALVSEALDERLRRDELGEILEAIGHA